MPKGFSSPRVAAACYLTALMLTLVMVKRHPFVLAFVRTDHNACQVDGCHSPRGSGSSELSSTITGEGEEPDTAEQRGREGKTKHFTRWEVLFSL